MKKLQSSFGVKVGLFLINILSFASIILGTMGSSVRTDAYSLTYSEVAWDYLSVYDAFDGLTENQLASILRPLGEGWYYFMAFGIVFFVISTIMILICSGHKKNVEGIHLTWIEKIPYAVLGTVCISVAGVAISMIADEVWDRFDFVFFLGSGISLLAMLYISMVIIVYTTIVRFKGRVFWKYSFINWLWKQIKILGDKTYVTNAILAIRDAYLDGVGMEKRYALVIAAVLLVEFLVVTMAFRGERVFTWIVLKALTVPVIIWCLIQWQKVRTGIKQIKEGGLKEEIDTSNTYFDFKKDIENLNSVYETVKNAVEAETKSDRLKTELITNVSHDIKTPLTSIINYVDLLGKEYEKDEPSSDTEKEYVAILSKQSSRLKKLIEDLIEASKATTGNIKMDMNDVDVSVILNQAAAEFDDRLEKAGLSLVMPENHSNIMAKADGRHLWRVFDNLLVNITKYSMANTRVYITAEDMGDKVRITFKNISREPLNISADELMERFTRGDSSRNTEGSGLGLSIASSLTNLMGGRMDLSVDGDLFKATVELEKA